MSVGDLSATMGLDIAAFTSAIDQALSRLEKLEGNATESIKKIESSMTPATSAMRSLAESTQPVTEAVKRQQAAVEEHSRTWSQFARGGIHATRQSLQDVGDASRSVGRSLGWAGFLSTTLARLGVIGGVTGAVAKTLGPAMSTVGKEMRDAGWYAQVLGKNYDNITPAQAALKQSTDALAQSYAKAEQSSKSMLDSTLSLAGNMSGQAIAATILWKSGIDEAAAASVKFLSPNSELMKAVSGTAGELAGAFNNAINMVADGIQSSATTLLEYATGFHSIEEAVDASGNALTSWAKFGQQVTVEFGKNLQDLGLQFGALVASAQQFYRGGSFDSDKYIEEGRKLNELAEQTQKVLAKQNEVKSVLTAINDAAGKAAADARLKNELARIATIKSIEAIEQEIQAMKIAAAATINAGKATKEWRKEQEAKAAALGQRKEDLKTGKDSGNNETAKAIDAAQKKLDELRLGEDEVALATARANGATDEQIEKLRFLQQQIDVTNAAKEAEKRIEDANRRAAEQLEQIRDRYDEITGAATKADSIQRKLEAQGVDSGLAKQIAEQTELVRLAEEKRKAEEQAAAARKKFSEQILDLENSIALAAGQTTKGAIAAAKALREGATEEEAQKIGELTDAAEARQDSEKGSRGAGSSDNQAVLEGTSEYAKIAFGGSSKLETLAQKQIDATKDVGAAIKQIPAVQFNVVDLI